MVRLSDTGGEDAEVPAVEDGEIAQGNTTAEFERDGLVSRAAALADQSLAVDQAGALNGDVVEAFTPDQAVMKVTVAKVLKLVPLIGLGGIVGGWIGRRLQRGAGFEA
jgi:hypothetical protein